MKMAIFWVVLWTLFLLFDYQRYSAGKESKFWMGFSTACLLGAVGDLLKLAL